MKYFGIITLVLLLAAGGCNRTFDSGDPDFTLPDRPPVPQGLKLFHLEDGVQLTWQISDTGVVDYFRVYNAEGEDGEFILLDTTADFSLDITTLNVGQTYSFAVAAIDTLGIESERSLAVSTRQGVTSMSINDYDIFTNSRDVDIRFIFPVTPALVLVSEDENLAGAVWRNYSQNIQFTLSSGDGTKEVFARLRFGDGSETAETLSDDIILDTRAFIDSTWFTADTSHPATGDTIYFYVDAGETGGTAYIGFPGLNRLDLFDDGSLGDDTPNDGVYSRRFVIPVNLEVDNGLVTGHFSDEAGNTASSVSGLVRLNIIIPADPVVLRAVTESSSRIRLDWNTTDRSDFASYRIYRDISTGVDESSELVTLITSPITATYTDQDLDDNQAYYYKLYVYVNDGLLISSDEVTATTTVNTAPSPVVLAVAVGSSDGLTIIISWTVSGDEDFESYQIYRGGDQSVTDVTGQRLTVINSATQTSFTDYRASVSETYYYVIYVYDQQGLKSERSLPASTP